MLEVFRAAGAAIKDFPSKTQPEALTAPGTGWSLCRAVCLPSYSEYFT